MDDLDAFFDDVEKAEKEVQETVESAAVDGDKNAEAKKGDTSDAPTDEKKEEHSNFDCDRDKYWHSQLDNMDNVRHALAVEAVATFFLETIPSQPGTTAVATKTHSNQQSFQETLFQTSQLLKRAHGVAVWALSSNPGQSVQYHIDYAELLRYEYNVTVPPLWAGTLQCSALSNNQNMKQAF